MQGRRPSCFNRRTMSAETLRKWADYDMDAYTTPRTQVKAVSLTAGK